MRCMPRSQRDENQAIPSEEEVGVFVTTTALLKRTFADGDIIEVRGQRYVVRRVNRNSKKMRDKTGILAGYDCEPRCATPQDASTLAWLPLFERMGGSFTNIYGVPIEVKKIGAEECDCIDCSVAGEPTH